MSNHGRRRPAGLAVLAVSVAVMAACGSGPSSARSTTTGHSPAPTTASAASFRQFAADGPYAAGTTNMVVNGDPVTVWYPAPKASAAGKQPYVYKVTQFLPASIDAFIPKTFPDAVTEDAYAGLPLAPGRFPVVLFSQGFTGYADQSSFLTAHLATWGVVVVSPEMTAMDITDAVESKLPDTSKPGVAARMLASNVSQQEAALGEMIKLGSTAGSIFDGHVNASEVGIVGHSFGGATAVETARADTRIKVVVSLAGVPTTPLPRRLPILFMTGTLDQSVPSRYVESFYAQFSGPKALVVIDGVGHNVFDDICTVNHGHGGIPGAITALHLPVPKDLLGAASDGCDPPDIYPPHVWPLIDQAVTAEVLYGLGIDGSPVGLGSGIDHAFAGLTASYSGVS